MPAIELPTSAQLTEGQQIAGCYLLKQPLAQGEYRDLWLARDEVLGKDVTLYFLPDAILQDSRAVADLRQEVKRNRQLSHPNILRIYDFVEDGGRAAITMDKLDAECLADLLQRKGAFEGHEIKAWLSQTAETLSDAHRIQLFHRDLSPTNLFIRPGGKVVVTNFGISRLISEALERAGEVRGEAAHLAGMSPQLLDGERPTASDDVYGLGALAFTLLTGRAPFTGENLVPQIRKVAAPLVNTIRHADRRPAVSPGWESLVAACLAKTPEHRPKTCGEIVTLLAQEKSAPAPAPASEAPASAPSVSTVSTPPSVSAPLPPVTSTSAAKEAVRAPVPPEPKIPAEHKVTEVSRLSVPPSAPKSPGDSIPNLPPPVPAMRPKPKPAPLSANYPDLERPKSNLLAMLGLLLAAAALGAGIYFKNPPPDPTRKDGNPPANTGIATPAATTDPANDKAPVTPVETPANPPATPPDKPADAVPVTPNDPGLPGLPGNPVVGTEDSKKTEEPLIVAANNKTKPARVAEPKRENAVAPKDPETPAAPAGAVKSAAIALPAAPAVLPKLVIPANATLDQLNQLLAERKAAVEEYAKTAAKAENVHAANAAKRDVQQVEFEDQKKSLEEKKKSLAPILKAADAAETERKRLEENRKRAETAAADAAKAATEAAKAAETAKTALDQLLATNAEKLAAREKADADLKAVTEALASGTRQLDELSQGASKAEALRVQMLAAKKQGDTELQTLTNAVEKASKGQRDAMVKANRGKIEAVEKQIREVDTQIERYQKAINSLKAIDDDSAKPTIANYQGKVADATAQKAVLQDDINRLSGKAPAKPVAPAPAPTPAATTEHTPTPPTPPAPPVKAESPTKPVTPTGANVPAVKPPAEVVSNVPPVKPPTANVPPPTGVASNVPAVKPLVETVPTVATQPPPAESTASGNSLGMKFAPVGDVQFGVYLVTRKNFQAFADSTNLKNENWKKPGFPQGPDHPVVCVSWNEAEAFCKWLTEKEHKGGQLKESEVYRLPTDLEWSKAVGLPAETGATPEERDMGVEDVYPWGTQWPPPEGAGNFAGEETRVEYPIPGYNDKFTNTSPVGSFKPNKFGLYDMGGNAWQWMQDSYNETGKTKVLRGSSWYNGSIKISLLSSCRISSTPDQTIDSYGFRIVRASK